MNQVTKLLTTMDPFTICAIVGGTALLGGLGYWNYDNRRRLEELHRKVIWIYKIIAFLLLFEVAIVFVVLVLAWQGYIHLVWKRQEEPVSIWRKFFEFIFIWNSNQSAANSSLDLPRNVLIVVVTITVLTQLLFGTISIAIHIYLAYTRRENRWWNILSHIQITFLHFGNNQTSYCGVITNGISTLTPTIVLVCLGVVYFKYYY